MRAVAIQSVGHARRCTKLGRGAGNHTQQSQTDERKRELVCVCRGCIKEEDIVATVHGDDITIGGERSAVEFLIRMTSKKYDIKKQVIGEDPDLEKSGRMLIRVIEWNLVGIAIEADQRHVREILKGLEVERANRSATPCGVEGMDEGKGESRCRQEQTQAEHEWDSANDGDDRDRPRMVDDNDPDSQALTNGDITRYRALVARISYLSQGRPDLKFASMQVCCAMAKPTMRDMERVKRIGRYLVGKPRARYWFRWQQSGEHEAYSTLTGEATRLPGGPCRLGSS